LEWTIKCDALEYNEIVYVTCNIPGVLLWLLSNDEVRYLGDWLTYCDEGKNYKVPFSNKAILPNG